MVAKERCTTSASILVSSLNEEIQSYYKLLSETHKIQSTVHLDRFCILLQSNIFVTCLYLCEFCQNLKRLNTQLGTTTHLIIASTNIETLQIAQQSTILSGYLIQMKLINVCLFHSQYQGDHGIHLNFVAFRIKISVTQ